MKRFLVVTALSVCGMGVAFAQVTNCSQTLRLANSIYEQGRLHELEELLKNCLKDGFTPTEKVQAYRLLTLAYIYLEEPEKADETMLKILQTDHYFVSNPAIDPAEFQALYNTFRHDEIYRLGVKLGGNMTVPNLVSSNSASNASVEYKMGYGFTGALVGEIPLFGKFRKFTINPELQFQLANLTAKSSSTQSTGEFVTNMTQKYSYVCLPVTAQYQLLSKAYKPYVLLGVSPDYLLTSTRSLSESRAGFPSVEAASSSTSVNKLNVSIVAGIGIRLRVAGGYFITEVRYKYGLSHITRVSDTFTNDDQVLSYKFAGAIYKLNGASLSIGYVQNFFNPKKLKPKK